MLPHEYGLEFESGLLELMRPFSLSRIATIATGGAASGLTVVVASTVSKGREGALIAFGFDHSIDAYVANPFSVNYVTRDGSGTITGIGEMRLGTYETQIGTPTQPVIIPGFPLWIPPDRDIAIVENSLQGVEHVARGVLYGVTWPETHSRECRRLIWGGRSGAPWPQGVMTRG
jgi:hypothetical protein